MYQVRAEAVNGLQVLSKGRWLTCIGNKPVRKGDLVWTDGRCVYGFYKEGQTPLVIFNPVVEEVFGIPILKYGFECHYFIERTLNYICNIGITKRLMSIGKTEIICSNDNQIQGLNIDRQGNIYSMEVTQSFITNGYATAYLNIYINKNGNIINSFTTNDLRQKTVDITEKVVANELKSPTYGRDGEKWSRFLAVLLRGIEYKVINTWYQTKYTHYNRYSTKKSYCKLLYAFIEDEYKWAIIISVYSWTDGAATKITELTDPLTDEFSTIQFTRYTTKYPLTCSVQSAAKRIYLIDNNGEHLLYEYFQFETYMSSSFGDGFPKIRSKAGMPPASSGSFTPKNESHLDVNIDNATIPMQDGFYYRINQIITLDYLSDDYARAINITIYSPNDTKIITLDIAISTYICAYEISKGEFLFVVDASSADTKILTRKKLLKTGMYTCHNGSLTLIDDCFCANQCLRPFEKYKDWQKRIQTI